MFLKPIKIKNLFLKNNVFIAPLAGYTNLPTRLIFREQDCAICYSEMVSAMGLKFNFEKSAKLIDISKIDKPIGVQLFGSSSEIIFKAFLSISNFNYDLIDINCGCSVKKVLKAKSGAYLLKDPKEIYRIIKILKENTDKPVTLKIRSGWDNDHINFLEVLDSSIKAKADLITFHPRTRSMLFKGKADWSQIKILKKASSIPVIGNGDIFSGTDAVQMMKETGCDGVMLARGLIENPFLIEEVICTFKNEKYNKPDIDKRMNTMLKHCSLIVNYSGERNGLANFRKFASGYVKGLPGASKFRQKINHLVKHKDFIKTIEEYCNYIKKVVVKNDKL
ncbi:MAG: tRNA dihydrouridine synthase DusB [Spirochaetes bacterium]|nr:tRNA dihydrouridine synthase DusB [Spirochaetota bacterium]